MAVGQFLKAVSSNAMIEKILACSAGNGNLVGRSLVVW